MYDKELALEIMSRIYQATQTILKRFEKIKSPDDFTGSDPGMEKLDAICMQLIAIGEGLSQVISAKPLSPITIDQTHSDAEDLFSG